MKMAVETNWKAFLSEDSEIPPDVSIRVKADEEEGGGKSFRAHKILLAAVSPVFRKQFFGPMKETMEVVEVKETTVEAFDTMLSYIYKLPGEDTLNMVKERGCPQKIFELLLLADRYQIPNLVEVTSRVLETHLDITRENIIFTVTVASNYKEFFDHLGRKVLVRCVKWIRKETKRAGDIVALILDSKNNFPEASPEILRNLSSVGDETLKVPGNCDRRKTLITGISDFNIGLCSDWIEAGLNKWQKYEASDDTFQVPGNQKRTRT